MSLFQAIGTDTEYFVKQIGGGMETITSAIGKIGGTKHKPFIVDGGNLQEDNVLAEYAVDPCEDQSEFLGKIRSVEDQLSDRLSDNNLEVVKIPSYHFAKQDLISWGDDALTLGCSPDFNVYEDMNNPRPSGKTTLRTAAGHVHFSYEAPNHQDTVNIIKVLDYTLGVWSVLRDRDTERRNLYGKAGSCRIKGYGGEYRTLSNFWLLEDADIATVFEVTKAAVENHRVWLPILRTLMDERTLQSVINNNDLGMARAVRPLIEGVINAQLR